MDDTNNIEKMEILKEKFSDKYVVSYDDETGVAVTEELIPRPSGKPGLTKIVTQWAVKFVTAADLTVAIVHVI